VRRAVLLALTLLAPAALAEGAWLPARGRVSPQLRLEAFGGPRAAGVGVVAPDAPDASAAFAAEALWSYADRTAELRGTRVWQLTPAGFATASASLGLSVVLVPVAGADLGAGPHAGLNLALGGRTFAVNLGLQAGVEAFGRVPSARVPLRALLGFDLALGSVTVSLMARTGADLSSGGPFVFRGDAILALGWLEGDGA
jgi:hypothetical protein